MTTEIQIGLWGPREAGKTTFLAMLYHECLRREWRIKPEGEALKFVKDTHRFLFNKGEFPPPTQISATKVYQFRVTPPQRGLFGGRSSRTFVLSFPDVGGEWYEDYEKARAQAQSGQNPMEILARCRGLLLLVDPDPSFRNRREEDDPDRGGEQKASSYFEMLLDLTSELEGASGEAGSTVRYVAVVLTKMDKPGNWEQRDQPDRFAQSVLTPHELRIIENLVPRDHLRYYASSAVGVFQDRDGQLRSNFEEFKDEEGKPKSRIPAPDKIQPFNVLEPLEWLMEMLSR